MKKTVVLILLMFISFGLFAQNQNMLPIQAQQERVYIEKKDIEILKDSTNRLTFEEIRSAGFTMFSSYSDQTEEFSNGSNYWLKFQIQNSSDKNGEWALEFQDIPFVDIFIISKDRQTEVIKTGNMVRVSEKQIRSSKYESIIVNLRANETKTIYAKIRFQFDTQIADFISISNTKSFIENASFDNLIQGIFHGLLWMMLLYNLFLFLSTGDKSYLYYIIYVFSFSVLMLFALNYFKNYFFYDLPRINRYIGTFVFAPFIFYYALMREFLDSRNKYPRLDKSLKIIILINAMFTFFIFLVQFIYISSFALFGMQFILLNAITLLVYTVVIFKLGDKVSRIFAFGTLVLILFISAAVVGEFLGGDTEELMALFQLGIVGEVFIFSVGLSYKYKLSEKEKQNAQESLIAQLKENQQLQTKVNRELEQKVRERTEEISEQKEEIQESHQRTRDSINYASRIQQALLPSKKMFSENLAQYFILYKPKDIVSGDFYYFKKTSFEDEASDLIIIAAADCTGHGVPGAFVSMLGVAFLNEIIGKKEINSAAWVLEELRKHVKTALDQTGIQSESKDGMDIALCIIDTRTKILQFAGAYNPLCLVLNERNANERIEELQKKPNIKIHSNVSSQSNTQSPKTQNKKLVEIKATRNPIGIHLKEKPFANTEIQLQPNDKIYMFSDGYADQFGGENRKQFLPSKFKQLLLKIADKPHTEQKQILDTTIENWKNGREQNDDIIVLGFEL